jgi:hypothetical protein
MLLAVGYSSRRLKLAGAALSALSTAPATALARSSWSTYSDAIADIVLNAGTNKRWN